MPDVTCPSCGRSKAVTAEVFATLTGKTIRCSGCKVEFVVEDRGPHEVSVTDDSDYEIPVSGIDIPILRAEGGICWACQRLLSASELPIRLDSDALLPVCQTCWAEIPVSDRMSLCIQFMDRWKGQDAAWEMMFRRQ